MIIMERVYHGSSRNLKQEAVTGGRLTQNTLRIDILNEQGNDVRKPNLCWSKQLRLI